MVRDQLEQLCWSENLNVSVRATFLAPVLCASAMPAHSRMVLPAHAIRFEIQLLGFRAVELPRHQLSDRAKPCTPRPIGRWRISWIARFRNRVAVDINCFARVAGDHPGDINEALKIQGSVFNEFRDGSQITATCSLDAYSMISAKDLKNGWYPGSAGSSYRLHPYIRCTVCWSYLTSRTAVHKSHFSTVLRALPSCSYWVYSSFKLFPYTSYKLGALSGRKGLTGIVLNSFHEQVMIQRDVA